ncbi:DNA repair protein Rad52/59/22 [Gracilaria domingensis]|nr:DNA repair protein Rad52/59/22 [Gracilaria domingensis]
MQRPGPGGAPITYLEGWKAIHEANQIFGFNGWSSEILQLDQRFLEALRGPFTGDRGGGVAENMHSKGDAILKAEKEAVTNVTKRALKNFGLRRSFSLNDLQQVRDMSRPAQRASVGANDGGSRALANTNQPRFSAKQQQKSPATAGVCNGKVLMANAMGDRAGSAKLLEKTFSNAVTPSGGRDAAPAQAQAMLQNKTQRVRANQEASRVQQAVATIQKQQPARASINNITQLNVVPGSFAGSHHANGGASSFGAAMVDARMAGRVGQTVGVQASNMNVEGASAAAKQQYDGVRASRAPSRSGAQRGVSRRCGGARGVSRRYRGGRGGSRLCRGAHAASQPYCDADCAARWCRVAVASSALYRSGRAAHTVRRCGVAASAVDRDVVAARAVSHGGVAV